MDIYRRSADGLYRCINNPGNTKAYALREPEDREAYPLLLPALVRVNGAGDEETGTPLSVDK
jgi:hypothetical protein